MELDIGGNDKVYPGSNVSVEWMGSWYDGTVIKIGPKNNLYKVADPSNITRCALIESNQLKLLDSKLTQSHNKRFAFNDGDTWLEVMVVDTNATGAAKVSWRKNVHSLDTETWFEKDGIIPNEASKLQTTSLGASRSGLLPVKSIEGHSRTVQNVVYQSDVESDESSTHNITVETEPTPRHFNQSSPVHANQHNMTYSPEPYYEESSFTTYSWNQPKTTRMIPPMIQPPVLPRVPPKSIAQSSMPCVWSYGAQLTNGIAPHHTSFFFHGLREKRKTGYNGHNGFSGSNFSHGVRSNSKVKYHPHSETATMNKGTTEATDSEYVGRRHSLYDQFLLHRDPRLLERTQKTKGRPGTETTSPQTELASVPEIRHPDKIEKNVPPKTKVPGPEIRPARRAVNRLKGVPPRIVSASPSIITVKHGESVLLTCTATGTQPIKYKWLKDGKFLPSQSPNAKYPGPGILQLLKTSTSDEGVYSCIASNALGSESHQFTLTTQSDDDPKHLIGLENGFLPEIIIQQDMDVQEYLDALVDEIHISDDESEYPIPNVAVAPPSSDSNPHVPSLSVSNSFNTEMEQYLYGYGDDYGQLSSSNVLDELKSEGKPSKEETSPPGYLKKELDFAPKMRKPGELFLPQQRQIANPHKTKIQDETLPDESANNSVEVLTSLGSSHSYVHADDDVRSDVQLPIEEESLLDQVKRFQSSMKDETSTKVKQKKWFSRIFTKRK